MKKYIYWILIAGVIVALHFLVIRLFFAGGDTAAPKAGKAPQTEKQQPVAAQKPPVPATPMIYKFHKKSENPLFGRYFSYRQAVRGILPGLSGSKEATSGILVDLNTRNVLWCKNPRNAVPVASMTKMMTLLLTFEELEKRSDIDLNSPVKVSTAAWKIGGSQVSLDPRETHPLGELLKTIAIKSANDSAYLVAEFINDNDVQGFVAKMNARARKLRMPNTHFVNPHGLYNNARQNSMSSAEGMAILAERLLEYPQVVKWASTKHAGFRKPDSKHYQYMTNTNKLIDSCPGVDGMKTGYIKASGFCITVTCRRGGRRLVAVVTGFKSSKARNSFVRKLLDWGYKRAAQIDANAPRKKLSPGKTFYAPADGRARLTGISSVSTKTIYMPCS